MLSSICHVRSVLQEEMQLDSTSIDTLENSDVINITSVLESAYNDSDTEVADMDTIPQCASIYANELKFSHVSFSVKGPLEFDCKVFNRVPQRDIFIEFLSPNTPIGSLPPVLCINDCKWVDTGQLSDSFDRRQYNQIKLLSKKFHTGRPLAGHSGIYLKGYYLLSICCSLTNWIDIGQELLDVSGCAPLLINHLSSSSDAPKLFDKMAERSSRWLSMLHDSEYIGEVEVLIEHGDNLTSFCNSYKLLGISLDNSFLYSLDRAATSRMERLKGCLTMIMTYAWYMYLTGNSYQALARQMSTIRRVMFDIHKSNCPLSDVVKKCILMFFEISENKAEHNNLYEAISKNIHFSILVATNSLALSSVVLEHSKMDLVAKLAAGVTHVFGLSMALTYVTVDVVSHVLIYAYTTILGIFTKTTYSFHNITRMQEYLKDPSKLTTITPSPVPATFCDPYGTQTWRKPLETTDAEEKEKQYSMIGSKDVLSHHPRRHISQHEFHFCKEEIFVENYSRSWNHFSSFMCTCNCWHIKLSYLEKTWTQLLWLLNDAFTWISSKLVLKVTIPWGVSWIAEILHVLIPPIQTALEESDPTINSDLNSKLHQVFNVCPLVLRSLSKELFGDYLVRCGCILWFEKQKEGPMLEVALDNEAFEEFFWVVDTDKEEHNNTTVFVRLYLNLEDKVLIEGGRIVMNLTKMEVLFAKMSNYIWDPEKMFIYSRGI
ncbi:hypothetical protein BC332_27491 [Capsicum chinense]|nr:hypothetical protein BC332_27491 [Capsicum chinense]